MTLIGVFYLSYRKKSAFFQVKQWLGLYNHAFTYFWPASNLLYRAVTVINHP